MTMAAVMPCTAFASVADGVTGTPLLDSIKAGVATDRFHIAMAKSNLHTPSYRYGEWRYSHVYSCHAHRAPTAYIAFAGRSWL